MQSAILVWYKAGIVSKRLYPLHVVKLFSQAGTAQVDPNWRYEIPTAINSMGSINVTGARKNLQRPIRRERDPIALNIFGTSTYVRY